MKESILIITMFFSVFMLTSVNAQGGKFKDFVTHEIQPKETVYSITRAYKVSKEYLVSLNTHLPRLKDNFLAIGSIIKIKPIHEKSTIINIKKEVSRDILTVGEVKQVKDSVVTELFVNWVPSFKQALKRAKKEKKPLLLYFTGSDWCRPCEKIDTELFNTEDFKRFSDKNIVLYKADFPKNKNLVSPKNAGINKKLSARYKRKSYPTMVMINDKGEVLGRKDGYYMLDFYSDFFKEMVKNYK